MDIHQYSGNPFQRKEELPNATASLVLGILAVVFTTILCFCYGSLIGLVLSIVGMVLASGGEKKYNDEPGRYDEQSYQRNRVGKILNLIALVISGLMNLFGIVFIILAITDALPESWEGLDNNMPGR